MASNLTAQVRSIAPGGEGGRPRRPSQQITVEAKGTANSSTPSPRSPRPVNGTPSGLFHQYREVPERTGQIAPKVPRHLTMKVTRVRAGRPGRYRGNYASLAAVMRESLLSVTPDTLGHPRIS